MNESSSMGTKNILYNLFPRRDSSRSSSPDAVDISFSLQQLFSASLPVLRPVFINVSDILIVKTKQRLQTRSKILSACLALTDLLTGLILQPACLELSLICLLQGKDKTDLCKVDLVFTSSFILFWFASVCHLVIMTCEQYGTINVPLHVTSYSQKLLFYTLDCINRHVDSLVSITIPYSRNFQGSIVGFSHLP